MQSFRVERAGFYQIRFANGRDAVIAVNPDRHESDLEPLAEDVQLLWSGSSTSRGSQATVAAPIESTDRSVSLWWYVMLLALLIALVEMIFASGHMGTPREEV